MGSRSYRLFFFFFFCLPMQFLSPIFPSKGFSSVSLSIHSPLVLGRSRELCGSTCHRRRANNVLGKNRLFLCSVSTLAACLPARLNNCAIIRTAIALLEGVSPQRLSLLDALWSCFQTQISLRLFFFFFFNFFPLLSLLQKWRWTKPRVISWQKKKKFC